MPVHGVALSASLYSRGSRQRNAAHEELMQSQYGLFSDPRRFRYKSYELKSGSITLSNLSLFEFPTGKNQNLISGSRPNEDILNNPAAQCEI